MNLLTGSETQDWVVRLDAVGVRYRLPHERIPSLKEYAIRRLRGRLRIQEFWALRGVSLEVYPGEVLGIIGPNGAGKSTLLKAIARVLRPTEGRVRVRGRVAPLLELGAGFDYELTGRENIYLNGAILGGSRADLDARFDRIVEFAGLREFIDAPLRTYSSGMVARLGFSVATDVRPEILIVDEILGVGDAEFQQKSFERIQQFRGAGTTILLVSHSLENIKQMCARAVWLDHGQAALAGAAADVVSQYLQRNQEQEARRMAAAQAGTAGRDPSRPFVIKLTGVRITGPGGIEQTHFQTGETLQVHMHYETNGPVKNPIFGVALHRHDGLHLTGPNTGFANQPLPTLNGTGVVIYTAPALPLLDGLYYVSTAVTNAEDTQIYDYHDRAYPFRVVNDRAVFKERYGLLTLNGAWEHRA